jgi:hypothetical protein
VLHDGLLKCAVSLHGILHTRIDQLMSVTSVSGQVQPLDAGGKVVKRAWLPVFSRCSGLNTFACVLVGGGGPSRSRCAGVEMKQQSLSECHILR